MALRTSFFSLVVLVFLLAWSACVPPNPNALSDKAVQVDINKAEIQQLYAYADGRKPDSLVGYFTHPDAAFRYIAVKAFSSIQDSVWTDKIAPLLADPVDDVRTEAAQAIGLCGGQRAEGHLLRAFIAADSSSIHQRFNATILEAIGRCGSPLQLDNLARISTYQPTDTLLLIGQCRAIYQFALRKITTTDATNRMAAYVSDLRIPTEARLYAANYFARATDLNLPPETIEQLINAFWQAKSPYIRMAIAKGLAKAPSVPGFSMVTRALSTERDYRVRCELIRALGGFGETEQDTIRNLVFDLTLDTNAHVSYTAARFFVEHGNARDADKYWRIVRDNSPWQTQAALYQAGNKWLSPMMTQSKDYLIYKIKEKYKTASNPYARAAFLTALGEYVWQYKWIHDNGFSDESPIVKAAAAEALSNISQSAVYDAYFGESRAYVRHELKAFFTEAIATRDVGMIYHAAQALRTPNRNFAELADSAQLAIIQSVLKDLKTPRDLESKRELEKTFAFLQGKTLPNDFPPAFNNPIDWALLRTLQANSKATIKTAKGDIELEFFPIRAPGSVANFLGLVQKNFFTGKAFHRVVPNFVAQGGCPRGDGFGALDYSIRTEISDLHYDNEGYVGMASAGLDTEGTQFFFTHSPTPHLDGRYTIFARVISGMEVVHNLAIGDKITAVTVEY